MGFAHPELDPPFGWQEATLTGNGLGRDREVICLDSSSSAASDRHRSQKSTRPSHRAEPSPTSKPDDPATSFQDGGPKTRSSPSRSYPPENASNSPAIDSSYLIHIARTLSRQTAAPREVQPGESNSGAQVADQTVSLADLESNTATGGETHTQADHTSPQQQPQRGHTPASFTGPRPPLYETSPNIQHDAQPNPVPAPNTYLANSQSDVSIDSQSSRDLHVYGATMLLDYRAHNQSRSPTFGSCYIPRATSDLLISSQSWMTNSNTLPPIRPIPQRTAFAVNSVSHHSPEEVLDGLHRDSNPSRAYSLDSTAGNVPMTWPAGSTPQIATQTLTPASATLTVKPPASRSANNTTPASGSLWPFLPEKVTGMLVAHLSKRGLPLNESGLRNSHGYLVCPFCQRPKNYTVAGHFYGHLARKH